MARKKQEDDVQEGAAWMTTYADMVTLLFTFFVLMFAISNVDQAKFEMIFAGIQGGLTEETFTAIQIRHGLAGLGDGAMDPDDPPRPPPYADDAFLFEIDDEDEGAETVELEMLYAQLKEYLIENNLHENIYLHPGDGAGNMLLMTISSDVVFASGSAEVNPRMREVAHDLARLLRGTFDVHQPFKIAVSGHTDTVPQSGYPYRNNWHLSVARATNFQDILIEQSGIGTQHFALHGHGEEMPLGMPEGGNKHDYNITPEQRQRNRRVEIMISQERRRAPEEEAAEETPVPETIPEPAPEPLPPRYRGR